ncbi:MAG TPA: RDD family protein [Opitutales bacterium]|nr:RDD family protein [Opitutales bacterium]
MSDWNPPAPDPANVPPPLRPTAQCVECGQTFPIDELIQYDNVRVCANCKPVFMQKLAEGAQIDQGVMRYASFWLRFAAYFVDGLIVGLPVGVIMAIWFISTGLASNHGAPATPEEISEKITPLIWLVMFGSAALFIIYETLMLGRWGATLGKMACKIQVVTADNEPISYARAFGRACCKGCSRFLSIFALAVFLPAAFDKERRAAYDFLCGTRVVCQPAATARRGYPR